MIYLNGNTIDNSDIDDLVDWLKTYPRLTKGPLTIEFEQKWAKWVGTEYAVFVNSGSSANLMMLYALEALGWLKNKKVVVPGLAWATDLAPVMQLGMEPILCDTGLDTLSVDLNELEKIFEEEHPAVLLLVSILGLAPDMWRIVDLCAAYDVILLEDACESLGSTYRGKKIGNWGVMSSFSTYFGHHISTIEGGIICTNNKEVHDVLLSIRSHGWDRDLDTDKQQELRHRYDVTDFNSLYTFYYPGFNLRATDLQAKLGLRQLDKLDAICKRRNDIYNMYQAGIKNPFWKPKPDENSYTSNFAYPIIHLRRNDIVERLIKEEVEVRPLVCGSMGTQPFYTKEYNYKDLSVCTLIDMYGFYVPNNHTMTDADVHKIINIVNEYD